MDGAPASGYRAQRADPATPTVDGGAPIAVITSEYGARVLAPLVASLGRHDIRLLPVANDFFGGNIGVAGLLTATDLIPVLAEQPEGHRYLLPDACLSEGRFLDDLQVTDLPRPVEIVPTDGLSLRRALEGRAAPALGGCGAVATGAVERVAVSLGAAR